RRKVDLPRASPHPAAGTELNTQADLSTAAPPEPARQRALFLLPLGLVALLFAMSFLPRMQESPVVAWSFRGASAGLLVWLLLLAARSIHTGRRLGIQFVPVRSH